MNTFGKIIFFTILIITLAALSSCKKEEVNPNPNHINSEVRVGHHRSYSISDTL